MPAPTPVMPAELPALLRRLAPADGVHDTAIPALQLIRLSTPGTPLPALYQPGLVLVVQGRKVATLGTRRLVYDPLHCLVVSVTMLPLAQVVDASPEAPYLCLRIGIDPRELVELMHEAGPALPRRAAASTDEAADFGLQVARTSPELLDAAWRLLRLLDTPQHAPVLAPLVLREIFYRVLTGELGAQLRALAAGDGRTRRIARAIELLKRRYAEPLRVHEMAQAAAMSTSSFHAHFKQLTALSPLQYQKQLRLHQARSLMRAEGLDAAAAAHRVGYESPSQFSRDYRRLFGAPPRAEARLAREQAVAAA